MGNTPYERQVAATNSAMASEKAKYDAFKAAQAKPVASNALYTLPNGGMPSGGPIPDWQLKLLQAANAPAAKPPAAAPIPLPGPTVWGGPSADKMAQDEFAAQFALLAQQKKQATGAYDKAGAEVGGMYDVLAKAIKGETPGIQKSYGQAGSKIGGAYNDAIKATDSQFSSGRSALEQMAARLGISQGLPSAESGGYDQQNRLDALMRSNKANSLGTNTELEQNDLRYNRGASDNTTRAGIDARSDFKMKLLTALGQLDNKGLELKGSQAAAKNKYDLGIQDSMNTQENNRAKNVMDQAALKEKIREFDAGGNKVQPVPKLDPYQTLAADSDKAYNNKSDAKWAQKIINDTLLHGVGDTHWDNATDFVNDVIARNRPADSSQLRQLAAMFYTNMVGGANKPYGVGVVG